MIRPNWMFIASIVLLSVVMPVLLFAQDGELPPDFPAQLAIVLGAIAPLVIQLINRFISNEVARLVFSVLLSLATGYMAATINGLQPELTVAFIVAVFSLTQASFNVFWKPLIFPMLNFFAPPDKRKRQAK